MKDIDFLPQRFRDRRAARKSNIWRWAVLVAFGGLVSASFVGQTYVRLGMQSQLRQIENAYLATKAAQMALDTIQTQGRKVDDEADLYTFLRHPWPRTQILNRVVAPLPQEVTLMRLHIGRDVMKPVQDVLMPGVIKPVEAAAVKSDKPQGTPSARDLKQLREECETRRVIVELSGVTSDLTALHGYLNALARERVFSQAELTSIESLGKENDRRSKFAARLVVAPGYGQRGGPTSSGDKPSSSGSPIAADSTTAAKGKS